LSALCMHCQRCIAASVLAVSTTVAVHVQSMYIYRQICVPPTICVSPTDRDSYKAVRASRSGCGRRDRRWCPRRRRSFATRINKGGTRGRARLRGCAGSNVSWEVCSRARTRTRKSRRAWWRRLARCLLPAGWSVRAHVVRVCARVRMLWQQKDFACWRTSPCTTRAH